MYDTTNTLCPNDGTVLVKTGDALLGQTLAGKYRIEERISEGGMGTVYRGTHVLMEKQVAIKVLHPSLAADDKIVARFTREAKAASRISHPHALTVTDFGESDNGIVFLVMEYLRGQTLKQIIRTDGPLPLKRIVEITRQVAGALDAAHAEGVVHRDLKSDNIMLEEIGAAGGDWAKVLDFGIAKVQEPVGQDPELTAPNLIIGTPQYMSPEQCSQSGEIDKRSDVYSFGVIIYEMLTGHVPFTGESATAIMLKHLQEPVPSISAERQDIPPAVAYVIEKALAKRREERQQSAGELAEALAAAAETEVPAGVAAAVGRTTGEQRGSNTDRIIVPTGSHEPRTTVNDDYDEATVVRPAPRTGEHHELDELAAYDAPPPTVSFRPWKIMIPAALSLLVIIGVFYAMSQRSTGQPAANDNAAPLTPDPNAQAVQPLGPPTGAGESAIAPGMPTPAGSPSPGSGAAPTAAGLPNVNDNTAARPSPTEQRGGDNSNAARNDNASSKPPANDNKPQNDNAVTDPTPPPSNKNDNQRPRPTPTDNDEPPPPKPTPKPTPRATPPPASTPPPVVTAPGRGATIDSSDPPPPAL
ncbi:MAG: protein kinase domain-containing protein [Pyrinomonadaceae bacterium]